MQQRLTDRLVGAAVLVVIAVIFIPMLLTYPLKPATTVKKDDSVNEDPGITDIIKGKALAKPQDITLAKAKSDDSTSKDKQIDLIAWVVQLGSFSSKVNADKLNLKLRKSGFPAFVEPLKQENETVYRVRVGSKLLRADADVLLEKIKTKMKLDGIVLNYP